jgi:OPA family glycerol-3-phosphate transporter-like MFS transporter 1/2
MWEDKQRIAFYIMHFLLTRYRASVIILTYAGYTCYHLSRKPISVVKNVLNQNCSQDDPPSDLIINDSNKDNWCDWAPFGKL